MAVVTLLVAVWTAIVFASSPAGAIQGGYYDSSDAMGASVVRLNYKGLEMCTGTVVGEGYVLTAAHCIPPLLKNGSPDWGNVAVQLWQNGIPGSSSSWQSKVSASVLVPPGATPSSSSSLPKYDVMLVQPTSAMPAWAKTVPMALTWPDLDTTLTEYGWGNTSGGSKGQQAGSLQKTPQGDQRRVACGSLAAAKGQPTNYQPGDICALGTKSEAWAGDSGGPLVWWVNGYWQQVGVASTIPVSKTSTTFHGAVFWSESDGTTRNWIRGIVTGNVSGNTILHDNASTAAWLLGSDGYRHWIPDTATYDCLTSQYGPPVTWPLRRIETIPDMVGDSASATCSAPPPTQDNCPGGDYSGNAYDGTCGTPPPSRSVTTSWGARAPASYCGGDTSCTYLTISWSGFGAGNHTIAPYFDGQGDWCAGASCSSTLIRSGSSGSLTGYWAVGYCAQSHIISSTVDGVGSGGISTTSHGC